MILLLFAALLTAGVLAALLIPLLRPHAPPPPAERFNAAVYRQQLDELDADVGREVLPGSEAAGARVEIERRLLNAARRAGGEEGEARRAPAWAAVVVGVLIVAAGAGLYLLVGEPGLPDQPFTGDRSLANAKPAAPAQAAAPDAAGTADRAQFEQLIAQLEQRMVANPGDEKGWLLLARGLMRMDRAAEASAAYAHALQIDGGKDLGVVGEAAEARVIAANGTVDAQSKAAFEKVIAADPKAVQPRFYLGLAKAQAGDQAGALAAWKALAADSPPDAPYLPMLKAKIAQAGGPAETSAPAAAPAPTGDEASAIAALPAAQQEQMIRRMVDQLAARLKANPDDADGWRRLARARTVLGQADQASAAWRQVLRLDPTDADAKAALSH